MPARTMDAIVDHINSLAKDQKVDLFYTPARFGDDSFGVRLTVEKQFDENHLKIRSRSINVSITSADGDDLAGVQVLLCNAKDELIDIEPLVKSERKPNEHWCKFTGVPKEDEYVKIKLKAK